LTGQGTFILDGNVEDSATAEISRLQVWQWIHHGQVLTNDKDNDVITLDRVKYLSKIILEQLEHPCKTQGCQLFLQLIQSCPEFITTWLNTHIDFVQSAGKGCVK
jgi:malate synthase